MPWKRRSRNGTEEQEEMQMAKHVKAIELVFKAQPMMALLLELMKEHDPNDQFTRDVENWLTNARELLDRKQGVS